MGKAGKKTSPYKRHADDWYIEPLWVTEGLFSKISLGVSDAGYDVWDPACGQGNIIAEARRTGFRAIGTDLVRRHPLYSQLDFLNGDTCNIEKEGVDWIVTNPPYQSSEAFLKKAMGIADRGVWIFQRLGWIAAKQRAPLLQSTPLTHVLICSPRPSCLPGTHREWRKAKGSKADFAWFGFVKREQPSPRIELDWIIRDHV